MQKRLIEYDLPLTDISEESAREKNIRHGHPSTLHIWWARRPLASSRATAFAVLIDDPGPDNPQQREYLLDLIKRITPWEAVKYGNSEDIEEARQLILQQYGRPPRVLDPFAGGGSIPLEALRLGCETYANDYNPVAVFIEKATLEWPQKFGIEVELPQEEHGLAREACNGSEESESVTSRASAVLPGLETRPKVNLLAYLVEKWANIILEEARAEIGRFYPEDEDGWIPVGYLWARTIPCQNPSCGAEIPLVKQFWLAKKSNKKIAYRPIVDKEKKHIEFELLVGEAAIKATNFDPSQGTVSKADARCLVCEQVTKASDTRRLAHTDNMGQRVLIVVQHNPKKSGKRYRMANGEDERVFTEANMYLQDKLANWPHLEGPLPDEAIPTPNGQEYKPGNPYYNFTPVVLYGITKWRDLFNTRQQLALVTFMDKITNSYPLIRTDCEKILKTSQLDGGFNLNIDVDELAAAVASYLAAILSRLADKNAAIVVWNNIGEKIEHVFGRQALPMAWDYIELNVFSSVNGDWTSNRDWILRYINTNPAVNHSSSHFHHASATELPFPDNFFDAVLTDPPYYDNVPYADLSDFFVTTQTSDRVWRRPEI